MVSTGTCPHKCGPSRLTYRAPICSEIAYIPRLMSVIYPFRDVSTFGAPICSDISSTLAWGRKVPNPRSVPREGCTILESCLGRGYAPAGESYALCSLFTTESYLSGGCSIRASSNCITRRVTQNCVLDTTHSI